MVSISMMEARLPPGFRFHPWDDELVLDYLSVKLLGGDKLSMCCPVTMVDVDLNKCEPWELPEIACVGDKEWYFFSQRDRKYATGQRTNRATQSGYWKATGKDRHISRRGQIVGMRKTLVFYRGRAPKGKKTDWVMHEFRMEAPTANNPIKILPKEDWVLCRVFYKSRSTAITRPTVESYLINESNTSAMPPLVDAPYITFEQPVEQVHCFSVMTPATTCQLPAFSPMTFRGSGTNNGVLGRLESDEKKVLKTCLSNVAKFDENGLSSMWNPF